MSITLNKIPIVTELFPDGTQRIKFTTGFPAPLESEKFIFVWKYEPNEEMSLYYSVKHIKNLYPDKKLTLFMPYIPNARMDRVYNEGEVFTLKYFADFINSLGFSSVLVKDAHSDVSLALINHVRNVDSKDIFEKALSLSQAEVVFYPDAGAKKRYGKLTKLAKTYGIKQRDWETGLINSLVIENPEIVKGKKVLIVDDICSYGGTFTRSTKELMKAGATNVSLVVSHTENNVLKGELLSTEGFDKLYTTDSIFTEENEKVVII